MDDDQITQHEINILIIDDDALVRQSVADYLSESGYEVHVASEGRSGLTL